MSQQHDILASLQEVEMDAGTVFSGTPSGTPVKGYAQPSPFTPKLNPDYVFHEHRSGQKQHDQPTGGPPELSHF